MFCQILKAISDVFPKALKQWSNSAFNAVGTLQLKSQRKNNQFHERSYSNHLFHEEKNIIESTLKGQRKQKLAAR